MADYERVLCVKNEVFVFKIPPRTTNRGYRAAEWTLDNPDWTGRMRVVALQKQLTIKLEDKTTGELFASAPIEEYPGIAVEQVLDSSRYFVIQIKDPSGKKAFIGLGFSDRGDSFDLNVSLQDHFKWVKREEEEAKNVVKFASTPAPKLDLGFKEGQTIKININTKRQGEDGKDGAKQRPRPQGGGFGLLPPPPGSKTIPPPAPVANSQSSQIKQQPAAPSSGASSSVQLCDFGSSPAQPTSTSQPATTSDPWGDFIGSSNSSSSTSAASTDWINFN